MVVFSLKDIDSISETENLLFNLSAGFLPRYLQKDDIALLKAKYGDDWFRVLGYTEPEYINPEKVQDA